MHWKTLLLLSSLVCVMVCGCVRTGHRAMWADEPETATCIGRFDLGEDKIVAYSSSNKLFDRAGQRHEQLSVCPGESFEARGFGSTEVWKLKELKTDQATFDVRGRYYGCTDPFAIWFGIPSARLHLTVFVRSRDECHARATASRPADR